MNNLRKKISLFFYQNNHKGISNLMMYIGIGNVIVLLFSLTGSSNTQNILYSFLCFNRTMIFKGQIWRLFSYVFTYLLDESGIGILFGLITLYCYYWIARVLEQYWGTLRFNVYYFSGVLLTDIIGLVLGMSLSTLYINMSLFLALATIAPDVRFYLWAIIPVKAKYLAWVDIILTLFAMLSTMSTAIQLLVAGYPAWVLLYGVYPLVALLNYILFFGKDITKLLPDFLRYRSSKTQRAYRTEQQDTQMKQQARQYRPAEQSYRHKCTVCGRTDVSNPELEFRYCSKCSGFHCYCEEHIARHVHIQVDA